MPHHEINIQYSSQDFRKPFDSPAVLVVGHQTSGKSALIEALMGFQFNQVGGGTKTRRPVALRMQYNPTCSTPLCYLTLENGKEEQKSLADIQVRLHKFILVFTPKESALYFILGQYNFSSYRHTSRQKIND